MAAEGFPVAGGVRMREQTCPERLVGDGVRRSEKTAALWSRNASNGEASSGDGEGGE